MAKEAKPKKSSNMQSFYKTKDKVEMAKYQAKGATHQMKINKAKGKLDNSDYRASTTATGRTKDVNRLNDTSKTLGRAKNIEAREAKAKQSKSRSYSPKPMTAAAKAKATAAGKATGAKVTARKPKAGSGVASKVASRAKSIAREVRDVPTAVGTSVMGYLNPHGIVARGPSTKNLAKQVKEAGRAVLTGKKGTASDRNTRSVRGEFGSSTGKYGYEKGKKRK
jgi:hypothetical protein